MNTLQLIHHIASHPEYTNIAIQDADDRTPMQAIEMLSGEEATTEWRVNGSVERGTLLVYS